MVIVLAEIGAPVINFGVDQDVTNQSASLLMAV